MEKVLEIFKKYLIPHEGNDHKPHILRAKSIAFVVVVLIVAEGSFLFASKYVTPRSKLFGIIVANALVDETNQNRNSNDLSQLHVNPLLQAAAQEKANDMATKNYFAHTSPQGLTPWYWFENVGYSFTYAGENLAVNFSDSQDVTNAWMNSPEHRANILNDNFTEIGMATAQGIFNGQPAIYVVELFGTPVVMAPVAQSFGQQLVNTAAAVTVPVRPTTPAKKPQPLAPTTTPAGVPVIVAMNKVVNATPEQTFVAIKGAETQTVPASTTPVTQTPSVVSATQTTNPVVESNPIQRAFSDPKALTNDFYFILMILFGIALVLNIFIKIRIQYPRLIASGVVVVVVAGLFVILNQNVALLHASIL